MCFISNYHIQIIIVLIHLILTTKEVGVLLTIILHLINIFALLIILLNIRKIKDYIF